MTFDNVNHVIVACPLPWPVIALGTAALAALCGRTMWAGWGRPLGKPLALLRALGTALVLWVCLQPQWVQDERLYSKPHIAVLVDRSGSMTLPLSQSPKRVDSADAWVRDAQTYAQTKEATRSISVHALGDAGQTDLLGGIEALLQGNGAATDASIDGLVLISDGADNVQLGALAQPNAPGDSLPKAAAHALTGFDVPISTVTVGATNKVQDVAIVGVHRDAYAFIKNTMRVGVDVRAVGYPAGTSLLVRLEQDGLNVARQKMAVTQGLMSTELTFVPTVTGESAYTVQVDALPNEATLSNNTSRFVTRVVRDKIRVLHVAGRPSWDQRFLREVLKSRAQVDLVSFYILRTPYSDSAVPENELALIPFPVDRLFTSELKNFDVVIFQNFDFRTFHMEKYLPNLAQAIDDGLGFMMLGGADSFGQGGYNGTALEARLPTLAGTALLSTELASMASTRAGQNHPLLALCADRTSSSACLPHLPKLNRINTLGALQPGAVVLAEATLPSGPVPLIVARDVGRGRTLALATDALWHWRTHDGAASAAAKAYDRFWQQTLLWLTHDPVTAPLQVVPSKQQLAPFEPLQVTVGLLEAPALGQDLPQVTLQLQSAQPSASALAAPQQTQRVDNQGQAHFVLSGQAAGSYALVAHAQGAPGLSPQQTAQAVVVVQPQGTELHDLSLHPALMARLSSATGGRVFGANAAEAIAQAPVNRRKEPIIVGRRRVPLWDLGSLLGALVFIWGLEWLLRRRRGLP